MVHDSKFACKFILSKISNINSRMGVCVFCGINYMVDVCMCCGIKKMFFFVFDISNPCLFL